MSILNMIMMECLNQKKKLINKLTKTKQLLGNMLKFINFY